MSKAGRPKGALNRQYGEQRVWEPRKWRVEHEAVVLMHINGKTNREIAIAHGKSEMWVSLVINSKSGKLVIDRIRSDLNTKHGDSYSRILAKATERVADYISNDDIAKSAPGAMADRSIRLMQMLDMKLSKIGEKSGDTIINNTQNNVTTVFATNQNVDRIVSALERTALVNERFSKLDSIETIPAKVSNG